MASRSKAPTTSETADATNREAGAQEVTEPVKGADDAPSTAPKSGDPLASVGAAMPAVQTHAIEAERKKQEAQQQQAQEVADAFPGFDAAIHEVGADGKPTRTKDGGYRRKRGGAARKLAGLSPSGAASGKPGAGQPDPAASEKARAAQIDAAAEMITQMVPMGGGIIFGAEAAAYIQCTGPNGEKINERDGMKEAWRTYFTAKGITDIPPGMLVAVVMISYGAQRWRMPQAQPRIAAWRTWIYGMWAKWKAWRAGKKYRPDTPQPRGAPTGAEPHENGATVHRRVNGVGDVETADGE